MIFPMFLVLFLHGRADTYNGPDNQVVLLSYTVSMRCTHVRKSSGEIKSDDAIKSGGEARSDGGVTWMFKAIESNAREVTVYKNSSLRYNPEGRWSVTESGEINELIITEARAEDAGQYNCIESYRQHTAQLMVLASNPTCQSTLHATDDNGVGHINENEVLSMFCRVQFWGNWPPKMQWNIIGGTLSVGDTTTGFTNDSMMSALHTFINSTRFPQTTLQFTSKTHFTRDNKPKQTTAPNIPQYSRTWSSPKIKILAGTKGTRNSDNTTTNNQTINVYILIAGVLGFFAAVLIAGSVALKQRARKKNAKRQLNPKQASTSPSTDYFDINEDEMRVEVDEPRVEITTDENNARTVHTRALVEYEAGISTEDTVEGIEYVNIELGNVDTTIYENESPMESGMLETETGVIGSSSMCEPSTSKNYVSLDASNREGPCPPSVYKRLKRMKLGSKDSSVPSATSAVDLDEDYYVDGFKPKLPTPESSSLSESFN